MIDLSQKANATSENMEPPASDFNTRPPGNTPPAPPQAGSVPGPTMTPHVLVLVHPNGAVDVRVHGLNPFVMMMALAEAQKMVASNLIQQSQPQSQIVIASGPVPRNREGG